MLVSTIFLCRYRSKTYQVEFTAATWPPSEVKASRNWARDRYGANIRNPRSWVPNQYDGTIQPSRFSARNSTPPSSSFCSSDRFLNAEFLPTVVSNLKYDTVLTEGSCVPKCRPAMFCDDCRVCVRGTSNFRLIERVSGIPEEVLKHPKSNLRIKVGNDGKPP